MAKGKSKRDKRSVPKRAPRALGPTRASQVRQAERFREKNARRKACRQDRRAYVGGRRARQDFAFGGAFGKLDDEKYNACVQGTTQRRRAKKAKAEEREAA